MNNDITLAKARQGQQPQQPQRKDPGDQDWWNVNSGLNVSNFGYADNFDATHSFVLPFFIDESTRSILHVGLTLYFSKFRGYTVPNAHTHDVTLADHTHAVTVGNHTHTVSIGSHTHTVSIGSHTHTVTIAAHTHTLFIKVADNNSTTAPYVPVYFRNGGSPSLIADLSSTAFTGDGNLGTEAGNIAESGGSSTPTSSSGGSSTPTSSSGGATTVTSGNGGGTTATSSTASGATFGIYEDTFPVGVSVLLDGIDITANLGGVFNPVLGDNVFENLDLTPFVDGNGLHVLEFTTTQRGRCLPLLWIKSIITR